MESHSYKANKPTLFLSYCSTDECIADIIEDTLNAETNNGIAISRYTRVAYRRSFKEFMKSIRFHDYVLTVVSDSYLKSQACMYEVGEIVRDPAFKEKLLFVVLSDKEKKYYPKDFDGLVAAKIYGSAKNRLKYSAYWQTQFEELNNVIDAIDDKTVTSSALEDLKQIERILKYDLNEFLDFLSEYNGKSFEQLYSKRFSDIISMVFPKWEPLFSDCKDMSTLLEKALNEICAITRTDYNQIALLARRNNYDSSLVIIADSVASYKQRYNIVIMDGVMGEAFFSGETKVINSVKDYERYFPAVSETESEVVIPIVYQGNTIGIINSESEKEGHYTNQMVRALEKVALHLSISLQRTGYKRDMPYRDIEPVHIPI